MSGFTILLPSEEPSELAQGITADGRHFDIMFLTFGRARINLKPSADALVYIDGW